jgi:type IV secretion system protein VirB4
MVRNERHPSVLTYLFHRLGRPFLTDARSLLILDEAWIYLDNPIFAARIREVAEGAYARRTYRLSSPPSRLPTFAGSSISSGYHRKLPQRIFLPMTGRSSRKRDPPMNASG